MSLSRGWALGTEGFKQALVKDHALASATRAWAREGAQEIRAAHWERALGQALKTLGRTEGELQEESKSAQWKVALGAYMKERTQVSNPWLAQRLAFGRAAYASRLVSALLRRQKSPIELIELREKCTT